MKNILVVGLSTYDLTVPMQGALVENQKYRVSVTHEGGGGPAFNAAYLCAKWGARTYLRSCLGTDAYGAALSAMLGEVGVNPEELLISGEAHTSYSYIYTNMQNGNRTIMNFRGEPEAHHHFFTDKKISVILTDGHEPVLSMDAFAQYPDAVKIMDAGNFRENMLPIAKEVDYLVCSQVFAEGYTKRTIDLKNPEETGKIFERIEAIHKKTAVITLGENGLLYRNKEGNITVMPAFPVHAVDTTGAGDVFHGAFTYGMAADMDFEEILRLAQMASAVSVQIIGSQNSIPERSVVEEELSAVRNG